MTDYKPQVGDRVRVAREGRVDKVRQDAWGKDLVDVDGLTYSVGYGHTFEKLADPEPEWVNGDIVQCLHDGARGSSRVRLNGSWVWLPSGEKSSFGDAYWSEEWKDGRIEILYKANAYT